MFKKALIIIPFALLVGVTQVQAFSTLLPSVSTVQEKIEERVLLAKQEMDLGIRYANPVINGVFKDNILLNLAYISGRIQNTAEINWDEVRKPSKYEFVLQPGQMFAYHDGINPVYQNSVVKIGGSHFGAQDGYRSSGYLYGDGVCHFATLMNWAAKDAGLEVIAPTNHNFAPVPGVDPVYGTSIYYDPAQSAVSAAQNLYIKNTFDYPVTISIESTGDNISVGVYK